MMTTIQIAERAEKLTDSITMAISALATQMKKEGKNVIGLSAGEPDFDTPEPIAAAGIAAIQQGKTRYTAASGMPELRSAICASLKKDRNLTYTPDQIVVSCGAKHSIYNAFMATLNPGDEVIIPSPYWVSYPEQAMLAGAVPVIVNTDDSTAFKLTPELLKSAITPRTKLLVLCSPSNPTGSVYTRQELEALVEPILSHNIMVLSDEIYDRLIYDVDYTSIATLSEEMKRQTILVNGVSKTYAMTGWRIGYFAAEKAIASAAGKIQSHSTSNPATPAQWAALRAYQTDNGEIERTIDTMRTEFDKRRQFMVAALNNMPFISCVEPKGAFYAFPNIEQTFGKKTQKGTVTNSLTFCQYLLEQEELAVVPGSGFGADAYIRLSYAESMDTIQEAMTRLERFVKSLV